MLIIFKQIITVRKSLLSTEVRFKSIQIYQLTGFGPGYFGAQCYPNLTRIMLLMKIYLIWSNSTMPKHQDAWVAHLQMKRAHCLCDLAFKSHVMLLDSLASSQCYCASILKVGILSGVCWCNIPNYPRGKSKTRQINRKISTWRKVNVKNAFISANIGLLSIVLSIQDEIKTV